MKTNTLLIDDNPLQVLPRLAEKVGLNEALVLQQLHYWLNRSENMRDGIKWVFNSYPGWKEQFPFWGVRTIQRTFLRLENLGLIKVANFNKMKGDLTKWYTVDYAGIAALEASSLIREKPLRQNGTMPSCQDGATIVPERHQPLRQNDAAITRDYVPEITSENTTPLPPKEKPAPNRMVVDEKFLMRKKLQKLLPANQQLGISPAMSERFHEITDSNPLEWCQAAFDICATGNHPVAYLIGILNHWQSHGFKCACHDPKAASPGSIPINRPPERKLQPQLTAFGTPFADTDNLPWYPKDGVYGKDFIFTAKQA